MSTTSREAGAKGTGSRQLTGSVAITALLVLTFCSRAIQSRRLLEPAAGELETVEAYTCIESGVGQHPCVVNPAYTFTFGFKADSSNLADRAYQEITAQHVICQQYKTQASCQSTPAQLQCAWDNMNSRCMADPYASLLMPLSCTGSKARSFMTCGRKGQINACRTDAECVLGKAARCFPAWLVSEARAKNTTEQDIAEATALAILKGDEAVIGSCPESKLLQKAMQACPYSAGWDTCDTALCEFSTPSFIPSRVQPLDLGNTTATVPMIYEASAAPSNSTGELPFFDTYPGPICFPDVARTPMVLHGLLGVSSGVAAELEKVQKHCTEDTEDIIYDVKRGVAACGLEMFSYDSSSVHRAVGMQKPWTRAAPAADTAPVAQVPNSPSLQNAQTAPAAGQPATSQPGGSSSSSSSSGSSGGTLTVGSTGDQQQRPKVATEIGSRVHTRQ